MQSVKHLECKSVFNEELTCESYSLFVDVYWTEVLVASN